MRDAPKVQDRHILPVRLGSAVPEDTEWAAQLRVSIGGGHLPESVALIGSAVVFTTDDVSINGCFDCD
jgi:hypothetical protein